MKITAYICALISFLLLVFVGICKKFYVIGPILSWSASGTIIFAVLGLIFLEIYAKRKGTTIF